MSNKSNGLDRELIPLLLRTPAFIEAWELFQKHRKEKKAPLTPTAARMLLKKLEEWGSERAVIAVVHSIANGWTGVFEPRHGDSDRRSITHKRQGVGW